MNTLGFHIAQKRKERKFTQEELAAQLDVSAQAVSKWENDISCPDISLLPKLAQLLGCSVDELLTGNTVMLLPENQRKPLEQLTLRVLVYSAEGDKVRVNLPMPLVKLGVEMGIDMAANMKGSNSMEMLRGIDFSQVIEMVEQGMIGKIVEVESADGDIVEIVVE